MQKFGNIKTKVIEQPTANDLQVAIQEFFDLYPNYFLVNVTANSSYCATIIYIEAGAPN